MELAYYSDYAVRLVNTEEPARGTDTLTSLDAVRELCGASTQMARRLTDGDLTRLRAVRVRLRAVFGQFGAASEVAIKKITNCFEPEDVM